jgi:hypothetical protein
MMMQCHVGRLIDHVHPKVCDIAESRVLHHAAFGAPGLPLTQGGLGHVHADELYVGVAHGPINRSAPSIVLMRVVET